MITFANKEFCDVAEYSLDDLIGKPHSLVRHSDMPKAAFADLWDSVKKGMVWQGYVKNKTKSGGFYWVFATVYPYLNDKKEQCYMSCRRKATSEDIRNIEQEYRSMR
jgi:PAS domain-containing protein